MKRREFVQAMAALALLPQQSDWKSWRVNGARVNQHLAGLSRFGANPQGGVSRVAFSEADIAGRRFMMDLMRNAGLTVRVDPVGNIFGVRAGSQPTARPILFGSHIDSVPEGGNYDGDVGSCGAIEVAHTLADRRYGNQHPLHVVIWCDEESGLTGSRGFIGDLPAEELARPGRDGVALAEKIRRIGGDPTRITAARHGQGGIAGYIELHIEQGGILDERGIQIGIVEGIVGIHHYDVTLKGFANHAGTTPMDRRRNAMLAAAQLVLIVDRVVRSVEGRQVGTVGRLLVKPGAPNVIPGQVDLTVELRDLSTEKIEQLWTQIHAEALAVAKQYDVTLDYTLQHTNPPALSTPAVRAVIADAVRGLGLSSQLMPSGAGHDAQDLARIAPMGMIFVPSVKGISHSPLELTRPDDVTNGANVLLQTVLRMDQA
ncbi:MAG TPA: M20 family metallo-hydrolase [Gemmatimonadales bacterium]|nr:M20 family metallo-hydrolase [Gemmatimonadales bacterium]